MEFLVAIVSSYLIAFLMAAYKTSMSTKKTIDHLRKLGVRNFEGFMIHRTPRDRLSIARNTAAWGTIYGCLACIAILAGLI